MPYGDSRKNLHIIGMETQQTFLKSIGTKGLKSLLYFVRIWWDGKPVLWGSIPPKITNSNRESNAEKSVVHQILKHTKEYHKFYRYFIPVRFCPSEVYGKGARNLSPKETAAYGYVRDGGEEFIMKKDTLVHLYGIIQLPGMPGVSLTLDLCQKINFLEENQRC